MLQHFDPNGIWFDLFAGAVVGITMAIVILGLAAWAYSDPQLQHRKR